MGTMKDMLLNCVAVNFLPDVDISVSSLLQLFSQSAQQRTKRRIKIFEEVYPESRERQDALRFWQKSLVERVKERPAFFVLMLLSNLLLLKCAWNPFDNTFLVIHALIQDLPNARD